MAKPETHERTLIIVKPDGVQRGLVGQVIHRFERKGLKLIGIKMMRLDNEILRKHYSAHVEKSFYGDLENFMMSNPVVAMVWEGLEAVSTCRKIVGATKGREAEMGSIRGDFGMSNARTLIHGTGTVEEAEKEVNLFFTKEELFDYDKSEYLHVYAPEEL